MITWLPQKAKINHQTLLDVTQKISRLVNLILGAKVTLEAQMNQLPVSGDKQRLLAERMNQPDVSRMMDRFLA